MAANNNERIICQNKRAYHDYFISDEIEAGIVLVGTEIKSIRNNKVSIQDAYCEIKKEELNNNAKKVAQFLGYFPKQMTYSLPWNRSFEIRILVN